MNDTGHYLCSSRPRTIEEQNELEATAAALFAKASGALDDMGSALAQAVEKSREDGDYDKMAGLDDAQFPKLVYYEDQLPEDYPYNEMFPHSQIIFGVRMFPELPGKEREAREPVFGNGKPALPRPEWVRGVCPQCGSPIVSNCYWISGRGCEIVWECWASLASVPTCSYRIVL